MTQVRFGISGPIHGEFRNMGSVIVRLPRKEAARMTELVAEMRSILRSTGNAREAEKIVCEVKDGQ